jgi:hypothetical protein
LAERLTVPTVSETLEVEEPYDELILADHPLVYWPLDDTAGTTFRDMTSHARHGELVTGAHGATFQWPGAVGGDRAVHFGGDGTINGGSELLAPTTLNDLATGAFTLECWAQLTSALEGMIALKGDGNGEATMQWWLWWRGNNFDFTIWNTASQRQTVFPTSVPVGTAWRHLVGTFDGATLALYVNGLLASSAAFTGTMQIPAAAAARRLRVSAGATTVPSYPFPGPLTKVALYDVALTPAQILARYRRGRIEPAWRSSTLTDEALLVSG